MNKDEFLKKVNDLSYDKSHWQSSDYEAREGFNYCKEKVLKLIPELDIEGMSPDTFALFRNVMNDLTSVYNDMFQLQRELQEANRVIIDLQSQLTPQHEDKGV